jgi:hypothetical protein
MILGGDIILDRGNSPKARAQATTQKPIWSQQGQGLRAVTLT